MQIEALDPRVLLTANPAGEMEDTLAQVVAVVPQPITRGANGQLSQARNQIVVHFNENDLLDGPTSAENPALYQLIFTQDTITNTDDRRFNPTLVQYDPAANQATLTFAGDLDGLAGDTGTYRLRIGTSERRPATPEIVPVTDAGSSFVTSIDVGTIGFDETLNAIRTEAKIISGSIDPEVFPLDFPGGSDEPGHRDLPAQPHFALQTGADGFSIEPSDTEAGIATVPYNFQNVYGADPRGNPLLNLITDNQRQRAREVFDIYGSMLGVQFYETRDSGLTIVTGDLRALVDFPLPTGQGQIIAASGDTDPDPEVFAPTAIMDNAEAWNDAFGGSWYQAAMREIGRLLGLGTTPELAAPLVTDNLGTANWEPPTIFTDGGSPQFSYSSLDDDLVLGITAERIFPGDAAIVHGQHLYRPEAIDIDLYRFELPTPGVFTAETIAERLNDSSLLDTTLTLYSGFGELLARNDDYFSEDSFMELDLDSGTYFIGVAASGNVDFDPIIENTGLGGTSQGRYDLRIDFRPAVQNSMIDQTGVPLDGDADGRPGGVFNFWFQPNRPESTVYVDKSAQAGGSGSLTSPFNNLRNALTAVESGEIIRIVGNGGADGNLSTLGDNQAYEIGFSNFGTLSDGPSLEVPEGVTVMIDAGAIFKVLRSNIHVGSSTVAIDRSTSALQVLGTPNADVIFTSADDETIGVDTNQLVTSPDPGDWGGLIFQNDVDRSQGRFDYEQIGVYLNYVNHADIRYGGGNVTVDSVQQVINPIHLFDARPTITFNRITDSADAAISANPDSFEESRFNAPDSLGIDFQAVPEGVDPETWTGFTADYDRVGPNIRGNMVIDNTTNGMFVRIDTPAGDQLEQMAVSGRFDDTDIVHVVAENLVIGSTPGGPMERFDGTLMARTDAQLVIDPGIIVKLDGARIDVGISAQLIAEGDADRDVIFTALLDDRFGAGGTSETSNPGEQLDRDPLPGDWGGIYVSPAGRLSIDHALVAFGGGLTRVEGSFAGFNALEIHQAEAARITNSVFDQNAQGVGGQAEPQRAGRGSNSPGAIFIRGAQPIIVGNAIQGTTGTGAGVISIDPNALNSKFLPDYGRSRGQIGRFMEFDDNQGPLIRNNLVGDNTINGMVVRSAVLTTESVWDDTDLVHVVLDQIIVPDFHSFGGLRLESSATESLVVKFAGPDAGFITTGFALENDDRIGGILNVIGQPGRPVVLTALADDTVGAGQDPQGRPQTDTDQGIEIRPTRTEERGSFQVDLNFGPLIRADQQVVAAAERAARVFERLIQDPITVTIDVEFEPDLTIVPDGIATLVEPETALISFDTVRSAMVRDAQDHEDFVSGLPGANSIAVTFPDTTENPFSLADTMEITYANAKALNLATLDEVVDVVSDFDATENRDARILVNPNPVLSVDAGNIFPGLADVDRTDGILRGQFDFTGYFMTAIASAIGFDSSIVAVNAALQDANLPRDISITPLDMFRFEPGDGGADFNKSARALDPALPAHVFFDGGRFDPEGLPVAGLQLGDVPLSRTSSPASWEDPANINNVYLGIAQPVFPASFEFYITEADRSALDVIGYDVVGGAIAGDWRGITLETLTHDRNVSVVTEFESPNITAPGTNAVPDNAQFLGTLAPEEKDGDENRRLGFVVNGFLAERADVDVYSFDARPGTEIWIDIDRTSQSLDSVVELVDANGLPLARSDNSLDESRGLAERFAAPGVQTFDLQKSLLNPKDHYSTNPRDAGLRLNLPGTGSEANTYHVRVRSSSPNINVLSAGQTFGNYQLQIRLQETDEIAGTSVQFADIRYATDGIRVRGVPSHSPLSGEVVEDEDKNNIYISSGNDLPSTLAYPDATLPRIYLRTLPPPNPPVADDVPWAPGEGFPSPQWAGNVLQSDRGAITIAGELQAGDTVDLYVFEVDFNAVQYSGTFVPPTEANLIFDLDYADGLGRANTSIFVYEAIIDPSNFDVFVGQLVFASKDGGDRDDLPGPLAGPDLEDLSRGSVGRLDPFLGPIAVPEGTYILAITNGNTEPTVLNEQFDVRLPANPFLRVTPIEKVARIQDVTFDGPPTEPILFDANSVVPFNLGDVTLFVTQPGGGMGTNLFTVDAFTGAAETIVGPLSGGFEVGDIAFANKYSTADPGELTDPTSTDNPLNDLFHPDNPRNLLDILFGLSLGNADGNSGNYLAINPGDASVLGVGEDGEITDDEIETYEVDDPAMPMGAVQTDEGVQFQAITFLNPQGDPIPYAIGHRAAISNILYTFDHGLTDTPGRALSDPGQDRQVDLALVDPPGTAQTQIVERGVLLTDADPQPGDNSALIVTAATGIRDGDQITLGDDTTVEFNIWPDALVTIDPMAGVFLRDGDQLPIDNISYEIETGLVLVVGDETGAFDIADGDTFTLTDNQRSPVTYTFEFDSGDGADSGIAVSFDDTTTLDELVASMIAAINSAEGFAIQASSVGNRISLTHESSVETSSSSISIEGAVSASAPRFIRIEETFSLDEVLAAFQRALPDAVVQDNRISFIGAASADFSEFVARGVFEDLDADGTLVSGTIQVDFLPTDTDEVIADRVATALSDFGVDAEATGSVVVISPDVSFASAPTDFQIVGEAPGGRIMGMAMVGSRMLAVTDTGGLFEIRNYAAPESAVANYLESSAELLGIRFSGLTVAPRGLENGRFSNILFGIDSRGGLHAFTTDGELQEVFSNGQSSVNTGIGGANGLAFSSLQENLWHITDQRAGDPGHDGGNSFRFGDDDRNIYFPGGAQGSLVSQPFSLQGVSADEQPTLYFSYFYAANEAPDQDAFRVYIADDSREDSQGQWHLLASSNPSFNTDNDPTDNINVDVQELFANTWQDVPRLRRPGEDNVPGTDSPGAPDVNIGSNGGRDAFPFTDENDNSPFPGLSNITDPADWTPYGTLSEVNGVWRQARIELGDFAGSETLRLRFDFSTAASFDIGGIGGVELKTIDGARLRDGETFVVDGQTFEFDLGYTVVAAGGKEIPDGARVTVENEFADRVVYEFDKDGLLFHRVSVPTGRRLSDGQTFTVSDGNSTATFELDNDGEFDPQTIQVAFTDADTQTEAAGAIADAIALSGLNVTASVDGSDLILNETAASLDPQDTLLVPDGRVPVAVTDGTTAINVAGNLAAAIAAAGPSGVTPRLDANRLNLEGASFVLASAGSSIEVEGNFGAAEAAVTVHAEMTENDVAVAVAETVADVFASGVTEVVKTFGNIVRIYGHRVSDPGPLGLADFLRGDETGSFNNLANGPPAFRGLNNNAAFYEADGNNDYDNFENEFFVDYEGVYVDDIIIGFASRGEALTDHRIPYPSDPNVPPLDVEDRVPDIFAQQTAELTQTFSNSIDVGTYQVEIRVADPEIGILNPADRVEPGITLFAPSGPELFDGKTFTIGDGQRLVTFEYEDLSRSDGVAEGHVPITYEITDREFQVASTIRDAVNFLNVFGQFNLRASSADGFVVGTTSTSDRVNLFGNAVVFAEPEPNGIDFALTDDEGSGNRFRDQGQLLISQSQIYNAAGYGVIVEDALRNLPSYDLFDPAKEELHSQFSTGDYTPQPGPVRNLRELNPENLTTGVSIVSNVIALNGEGGISYGGDPNGFVIVAPVADEPGDAGEVWDEFMFDIIDHNGLTRRFEFHDLQQNANPVAGTDYQAGNIPVFFDRPPACPYAPPIDRCEPRYSPIYPDVADHLQEAIEGSNLDVTVFRGKGDELFVEGATLVYSLEPDILPMPGWFEQFIHPAQIGAVPFGRIVNNTIVGLGGSLTDQKQIVIRPTDPTQEPIVKIINDFKDIGIRIDDNSAPTLLNNIIVNFEVGVGADNTPTSTVLGGMMFQGNRRNISNINVGDFAITLGPTAPLFVDFANGNYYPADSSRAIDSAIDSLEDRPELVTVKNPLGIARSPLLAPDRDVLGQLREDDPRVEPPEGLGRNVFKDRGAIDRVDFVGPTVQLRTPRDNDATGVDLDPALTSVALAPSVILRQFEIEFLDTSQLGDARDGTGVDAITVNADSVTVTQDGELLTVDVDYRLDFDVTNSVLRLTPTTGVWPAGNTYLIALDESLIRDIAGNPLQANQPTGGVTFTVTTLLGTDYGDAPAPYPTLSADNGARHEIKDGFFLGTGVTAEEDGQPSPAANLDAADGGVAFPSIIEPGKTASITVTASANGLLDGWIDFNQDGDWNDAGEQVFTSRAVNAGANIFNISVPSSAQSGRTFARFRFSSTVGLLPTGPASDGEVEDYRIEITARDAWQNRGNPLNVDANTVGAEVAPIDALLVINEINNRVYSDPATGVLPIPPPETPDGENVPFLDVDGNGFASPRDALLIINFLNDQATAAAEGEADDVLQAATAQVVTQAPMIGQTELVAAAGTRASAPSALAERSLPADAVLAAPEIDSVLDEIANDIATARAEQDDQPLDNLASAFAEFGLFDVDGNV